jgi:hypothetical protein
MTIRTHRHFETTRVHIHACAHCHATVIYGLAEGIPARVDPHPVDAHVELRALTAGRGTYTLTRTGLVHRDACRRRDPALAAPVLAEHDCPMRRSA